MTLAGRRRRVFCKGPRLPAWKETQTWDKHLPYSCDPTPEVDCHLVPQHFFLTSCLAEMPTESVLLPPQLCSDCGQWSATDCLLCHRHNQNSVRPVSSLSPKLYFSPTFRAPLLIPPHLREWKERDRKRVWGWQYPVQDAEPQMRLKTCSCDKLSSLHTCFFYIIS